MVTDKTRTCKRRLSLFINCDELIYKNGFAVDDKMQAELITEALAKAFNSVNPRKVRIELN